MSKITTAVIPVAGYGTRMFPVTKTISKEMLPLGNRPIIDYVVEDCLAAGVTRIVIVVRPDQHQVRHYYRTEHMIRDFLQERGAIDKYATLEQLPHKAEFIFVEQPDDGRYGTAIPLKCAQSKVEGEQFIYINGDALAWKPHASVTKETIEAMEQAGAQGSVLAKQVPLEEVSRYGVIKTRGTSGPGVFEAIIEKPKPEAAPSNLINLGSYIFNQDVFRILSQLTPDASSGEYFITDALEPFAQAHPVNVYDVAAEFLDVGTPTHFMRSNQVVADYL